MKQFPFIERIRERIREDAIMTFLILYAVFSVVCFGTVAFYMYKCFSHESPAIESKISDDFKELDDRMALLSLRIRDLNDRFEEVLPARDQLLAQGLSPVEAFRWSAAINQASKDYRVEEGMIIGIIGVESRFNPKAVSPKGAHGLMQLTFPTAKMVAQELKATLVEPSELFDPKLNIILGTYYFRKLLNLYKGDSIKALEAYNMGPGALGDKLKNKERVPYVYALGVISSSGLLAHN